MGLCYWCLILYLKILLIFSSQSYQQDGCLMCIICHHLRLPKIKYLKMTVFKRSMIISVLQSYSIPQKKKTFLNATHKTQILILPCSQTFLSCDHQKRRWLLHLRKKQLKPCVKYSRSWIIWGCSVANTCGLN